MSNSLYRRKNRTFMGQQSIHGGNAAMNSNNISPIFQS